MMLAAKLAVARAARVASRALSRGGTVVPGRVLLRLEPRAIATLAPRLGRGSVVISATNGKTTTAAMLASVLHGAGVELVHNRTGSNMDGGVATAMLDARPGGDELGLFEVDEAWLPAVARDLRPHTFLLSNLFRDQLDRYGELAVLAERWSEMVDEQSDGARLVLNADDPLVADLGRGRPSEQVLYFGLADDSLALAELQHAADSKGCGRCGHAYAYEAAYLAHLGRYSCPNCGQRRPEPEVVAERVVLRGMSGSQVRVRTPAGVVELELPLPGLYNVYNALAATATAVTMGVALERVKAGLEGARAAFGRVETLEIGGRAVSIMLVKNPAGATEVLRTLALEDGDLELWIALNDRVADGRDVSWMWDADFEGVAARIGRVTCSGTRAEEMALRMKYAGVTAPIVVDPDLGRSLDAAVAAGDGRALYALPTYTALLELRDLLADRGVAPRWSA
jgi:UDP-N-acetylmuramyl tripeptide synthase